MIMKPLHIVLVAVVAFQTMFFASNFTEARPFLVPGGKFCSRCWWMERIRDSRVAPPPPPSHSGGPTPMGQCGPIGTKPPHSRPRPPPSPTPSHGPVPATSSYKINHLRDTTPAHHPKAASA